MMDALTERHRFWLEHLRRASESGQTLKAYAQAQGISLSGLYEARSKLARRGILGGKALSSAKRARAAFVPVHVTHPIATTCRLRHPSGWVIECERLPDPDWLMALLRAADVSA